MATGDKIIVGSDLATEAKGYADSIFHSINSAYGLRWNASTDVYTRVGDSDYTKIQREMKRCTVLDDGTVNYYLDASDSTKKEDGTDAVLDGTDGQVMVEIPQFYYRYVYVNGEHEWMISDQWFIGSKLHPAFLGRPKRYIGAYEADIVTVDDVDIMTSISGTYPYCDKKISDYRTLAKARGTEWHVVDYNLMFAIQLLVMIEYGTMYLQDAIGRGRTQLSDGTWEDGSYYGQSGLSNSVGNGTGNAEYEGDADDAEADAAYMSYRGIENLYGNVWTIVEGVRFLDNVPYVSNNHMAWSDDLTTDFVCTGVKQPSHNGYGGDILPTDTGMFIANTNGSESTGTTDYYYQNSGLRILLFGASASHGSGAGAWALHCSWAVSVSDVAVGSRLAR